MNVIVSAMDLQLVRQLRCAMAVANPATGRARCRPTPAIEPRVRFHPTPAIEPRRRIDPTPAFQSRRIFHPTPRIEAPRPPVAPPPQPVESERTHIVPSPIQAPWKLLPWKNPPEPTPELKIMVKPPDVQKHLGTLDLLA